MNAHEDARLRERYRNNEQWTAAYAAWEAKGAETRAALVGLLPDGWSFEGKRVLDFGCGNGRTLRHFLSEAETAELWGADIDASYIAALKREHCPPLHAMQCGMNPPLPLEHGSFDLIWAISVFTHLTDNSIPWLLELHRLLKPDGFLVATYIGRWNSEFVAAEPWDENRVGMNVLQHTQGWEDGGPSVLMSDWWVRDHWGRAFDILEIAPRIHNMSWALMRKRDVELSSQELERPGDDPREYVAVRHNLRQVQRELEFTAAVCEKLMTDLRLDYERSLSWRVTRPLRASAKQARRRLRRLRRP